MSVHYHVPKEEPDSVPAAVEPGSRLNPFCLRAQAELLIDVVGRGRQQLQCKALPKLPKQPNWCARCPLSASQGQRRVGIQKALQQVLRFFRGMKDLLSRFSANGSSASP